MSELVALDPVEVATGRTQVDITDFINEGGPDWGDAAIEQYLAEAQRGQLPVDFRIPSRQIQIPLLLRTHGATTFATIRRQVQAKAALFQREGGWIKRQTAIGELYADITGATLKFGGGRSQALYDLDADAVLTLEASPDFYGDETANVLDDFSINTIADYTFDQGAGSVTVTGGQLVPSDVSAKRFVHTASPYLFYDVQVTAKITTGAAATAGMGIILKRLDANNCLMLGVRNAANQLRISKLVGGSETLIASVAGTLATATTYWIRARIEGNLLTLELWGSAPTATGSPTTTCTFLLTGADATLFGAGVAGRVGMRWFNPDLAERFDDFQIEPNVYVERTKSHLVAVVPKIAGDHSSRSRIILTDPSGSAQLGLLLGVRSRHYSAAATARLSYEAEALTPLDTAAIATVTGASGGGSNNVVRHSSLAADWTPVLSTDIAGVGALTHSGTYRLWVRAHTTSPVPPKVRLVYDVGDLILPEENAPKRIHAANDFYDLDLGEVRLDPAPVGTHRWRGQVQAKGDAGGENVSIDEVWLVPVDDGYTLLRTALTADLGLATYTARDEFNQSAGALTGKTLPAGGTWAGAGDADDFSVNATEHTARRIGVEADVNSGRYAIAGTTVLTDSVSQVDITVDGVEGSSFSRQGVLARYTDTNNWLMAWRDDSTGLLEIRKRVAGAITTLADADVGVPAGDVPYTIRLAVFANGQWFAYYGIRGTTLELVTTGRDSALATAGALASGKVGFYHADITAP